MTIKLPPLSQKVIKVIDEGYLKYPTLFWSATLIGTKHRFTPQFNNLIELVDNNSKNYIPSSLPALLLAKIKNLFGSYYYLCKIFVKVMLIKSKPKPGRKAYFALVKSFSYSQSFKDGGKFLDPFLGKLPEKLKEEKDTLHICEHLGSFTGDLKKIKSCPNLYNTYQFIKLTDLVYLMFLVMKNLLYVRSKQNSPVQKYIEDCYAKEITSHPFIHHILLYRMYSSLFKKYQFERVYSTYENNSWEKMLILAKNKYQKKVKVIAHQHVPISQAALNYFAASNEYKVTTPDLIVTTGKIPKRILLENSSYSEGDIIIGCGLRFGKIKPFSPLGHSPKKKQLLAALDGADQARVVLEFLHRNNQVLLRQQWTVVVRLHPLFKLKQVQHFLSFQVSELQNWKVSNETLDNDLKASSLVAYWGSTVAFEALGSSIPVICVRGNLDKLSNDPLWGVEYHKWSLSEDDAIEPVLNTLSLGQSHWIANEDKFLLQDYFDEVTPKNLNRFLKI